jgi:hypothetical protein
LILHLKQCLSFTPFTPPPHLPLSLFLFIVGLVLKQIIKRQAGEKMRKKEEIHIDFQAE